MKDLRCKNGSNIRGQINGEIVAFSKEALSHSDGITLAKELLRSRFVEFTEKKILTLLLNSMMITASCQYVFPS